MKKLLIIIISTVCLTSCNTLKVQKENQFVTSNNIMLGVVGQQKTFVLEQDYNHAGLPDYKQPIKVQPITVSFNKPLFDSFKKAQIKQNKSIILNFVDSVKTNRPTFLKLEIADKVGVLNALNTKHNIDVFNYIENNTNTHIVTSISIALNKEQLSNITTADEVFLETSGLKNYVLKTYKNKQLQHTVKFTDGVVFAYQTSNACWKEDSKYQLKIIDLVESNDKCPSKSYQYAKRAKKKIDYYNF